MASLGFKHIFGYMSICEWVGGQWNVKIAAAVTLRHSPEFPFTSRFTSFPFTGHSPACCKIHQITFTTSMDPHINMQICKSLTLIFSHLVSLLVTLSCFFIHLHPLSTKHEYEYQCGGSDDSNRNVGGSLKTKVLIRLKKRSFSS